MRRREIRFQLPCWKSSKKETGERKENRISGGGRGTRATWRHFPPYHETIPVTQANVEKMREVNCPLIRERKCRHTTDPVDEVSELQSRAELVVMLARLVTTVDAV